MKAYKGRVGIAPLLLNHGIRWRSVSDQLHNPVVSSPQRNPGIHGWAPEPGAHLDILEKKNISNPCKDSNPGASTVTGIT